MVLAAKPNPRASWSNLIAGAGTAALTGAWALNVFTQPTMSAAIAGTMKLAGAAAIALGGGYLLSLPLAAAQTYEDLAGGTHITGYPGCGKTYLVFGSLPGWVTRGFGGLWASPKGAGVDVLGRFPRGAVDQVDLVQPYGQFPRGLNLLQTYTGTAAERELLAGLVTEWFCRENAATGQAMAHLLFMGALALLEWAAAAGEQVTPMELYTLFHRETFRRQVLTRGGPLAADAFRTAERDTLARVQRLVARAIASESLMVTIGQRDGINLLEVMRQNRWLVLDAPYKHVPHGAFLCRTLASLVQMLTPHRPTLAQGSRPFMAIFDEIQEYPTPVFARGLAMAREYGVCWVLLHHSRSGQLDRDNPLRAAIGLAANKYWFRQTPEDAVEAAKSCAGHWEPDAFVNLPKRHYKALRRVCGGRVEAGAGRTPEVGPPDLEVVLEIRRRNCTGRSRAEILADVRERLRRR